VPDRQPLKIGEACGFALLQAAAFVDTLSELECAVRSVLSVDLPKRIDTPAHAPEHCVFKIGPEQYWIVGPEGTWVASLRDAVPGSTGSITPLSHGRARLLIEGPSAREVLSKGIALDLHPKVFHCNTCALTGLQGTPVLLHRTGLYRYELYVLRSFADWIWEWLTDAALPLGYELAGTSPRAASICA
jgi:sarcosine oxidase subunit gamma